MAVLKILQCQGWNPGSYVQKPSPGLLFLSLVLENWLKEQSFSDALSGLPVTEKEESGCQDGT